VGLGVSKNTEIRNNIADKPLIEWSLEMELNPKETPKAFCYNGLPYITRDIPENLKGIFTDQLLFMDGLQSLQMNTTRCSSGLIFD